jgi:uncharacterized membrane protein
MTKIIILSALTLISPVLFLYLQNSNRELKKINPIILCYILGLVIGNIGLMDQPTLNLMNGIASGSAIMAIPLMLFSLNFKHMKNLAGKAGLSMVLASLSVLVVSFIAQLIFRNSIDQSWQIAGLTIGVYTGGTPNLAAIRTALNIDMSSYIAVHTADMLWSALFLLIILTLGRRWISPLMPGKPAIAMEKKQEQPNFHLQNHWSKEAFLPLLRNFLAAAGVVGIAGVLTTVVSEELSTLIAILVITTLAILLSLIPKIRDTRYSFQLGEYFIYLFCISAGALGDVTKLMVSAPVMILFVGFVLFGSFFLHMLLCRLGGVDGNTMLITSTSAICSPPFVPVVAVSLETPSLILPGITTGLLGYALGNYLGVLAAKLFSLL